MKHEIVKVMHELKRRALTVRRAALLTPHMRRIVLSGAELDGFHSPSPDDHVKVFVPGDAPPSAPVPGFVGRDYTPRRYDAAAGELTIDFALHQAGPVTEWARQADTGHTLLVGGPRGSTIVPVDFDWWLLVGDETALPAIGRRIEELPAGTPVTSIVAVPGPADEQTFATTARHRAVWVHRPVSAGGDPAPLLEALARETLPAGDGFIWVAAESGVARAIREHVLETLAHPAAWTKVSSYWTR